VPSCAAPSEEETVAQCEAEVEKQFQPKLEAARAATQRAQRTAARPSLFSRLSGAASGTAAPAAGTAPSSALVVPGTLSVGADAQACLTARSRNTATLAELRVAQAELRSAVTAATEAHAGCYAMLEKDPKAAGQAAHVACVSKADTLSAAATQASTRVETLAAEAGTKAQTIVLLCGGAVAPAAPAAAAAA
jgi:hypothetical protein